MYTLWKNWIVSKMSLATDMWLKSTCRDIRWQKIFSLTWHNLSASYHYVQEFGGLNVISVCTSLCSMFTRSLSEMAFSTPIYSIQLIIQLARMQKNWNPVHCWWVCKMALPEWKTVWVFLQKLKIGLLCDPAFPLLDMYPKEFKAGSQRHTSTPMSIAALFTAAKR